LIRIFAALGDAQAKAWPGAIRPALAKLVGPPVDHADLVPVLEQLPGGGDAGDAGAHDQHVHRRA
jgi:hypothetical protein